MHVQQTKPVVKASETEKQILLITHWIVLAGQSALTVRQITVYTIRNTNVMQTMWILKETVPVTVMERHAPHLKKDKYPVSYTGKRNRDKREAFCLGFVL